MNDSDNIGSACYIIYLEVYFIGETLQNGKPGVALRNRAKVIGIGGNFIDIGLHLIQKVIR